MGRPEDFADLFVQPDHAQVAPTFPNCAEGLCQGVQECDIELFYVGQIDNHFCSSVVDKSHDPIVVSIGPGTVDGGSLDRQDHDLASFLLFDFHLGLVTPFRAD